MNENAVREMFVAIDENGVLVVEFSLSPGANGAWHHHTQLSEYCCCLKGWLSIEIEGCESIALSSGDKYEVAEGVKHRVCNESQLDCGFLVVQEVGTYDFVQSKNAL